jgi:hypothetical protein
VSTLRNTLASLKNTVLEKDVELLNCKKELMEVRNSLENLQIRKRQVAPSIDINQEAAVVNDQHLTSSGDRHNSYAEVLRKKIQSAQHMPQRKKKHTS